MNAHADDSKLLIIYLWIIAQCKPNIGQKLVQAEKGMAMVEHQSNDVRHSKNYMNLSSTPTGTDNSSRKHRSRKLEPSNLDRDAMDTPN
jgi:hypothetical protein